ncbi:MAG TPA: preprotein translocase subunit SecY [Haloplasmataceae bacterium]
MLQTLGQALKNADLRKRILFTILVFAVFKLMTFITVPLVDKDVLRRLFTNNNFNFGIFNVLTGNALENFSIIALGISPYITASIVIQLLQMDIIPILKEWSEEGETGRQKLNQLTRYVALALAFLQALVLSIGFDNFGGTLGSIFDVVDVKPIMYVYVAIVITAGTGILLWLSDQITLKGIGNGSSMIIVAGIISGVPYMMRDLLLTYTGSGTGIREWSILTATIVMLILVIVGVIYIQNATRKVPIHYANRPQSLPARRDSHLPIKLNPSGVIPVIFATSLMSLPLVFSQFFKNPTAVRWLNNIFNVREPIGFVLMLILIYAFSFFYAFVQVNPEKVAENLKKQGSYIPGIRPGKETENYLSGILMRTTVAGATFLAVVQALPIVLGWIIPSLPNSVQIGGTSLLIIVGVAQETYKQIETQIQQRKYTGFIK